MKKLALAAILTGTATLGVTGFAFAQHHGPDGHHDGKGMLEALDADGDGAITQAEVEALKASKFAEADTNGDGGLTMAEIEAFHESERARRMEEMKQRMFARADANGDGVISIDEFDSRGTPKFERADANDDGVISAEEIEAMKEKRGKRHGGRRGGDRDQ